MPTHDEWHMRWKEGRIGFHLPHVNPDLERWLPRLLPEPGRILVPLCGKTRDLAYLAEQGNEVVGVELVEQAVRDFFVEHGVTPVRDEERGHPVYGAGGVDLHVADMLRVDAAALGGPTAIYDRAALIALPADLRVPYAAKMIELLPPGGRMLLITIAYDQARMDGPPFSVRDDEVKSLYAGAGELERLHHDAAADAPPRFAELGLVVESSVWLLTRGG